MRGSYAAGEMNIRSASIGSGPGWTRTSDRLFRKQQLCPLSYTVMEAETGIEPVCCALQAHT